MNRFLLLALLAVTSIAGAVVVRHDVDDARYRIAPSVFPALADLPHEGHGVLIAPQWVVTAAHAVTWQHEVSYVVLNGIPRAVEQLVIHPGFRKLPQGLVDQALSSGDATLAMAWLAASDDIALLKLAQPVSDVSPVELYAKGDEMGQLVTIIGKGATAIGRAGYGPGDSHRTALRRASNKVSSADGRWFCYGFDRAPSALPLEGIAGNGDSGGPVLIGMQGQWSLAGLASWKAVQGNAATTRLGLYGQTSCNVRVSHYIGWIESIVSTPSRTGG